MQKVGNQIPSPIRERSEDNQVILGNEVGLFRRRGYLWINRIQP